MTGDLCSVRACSAEARYALVVLDGEESALLFCDAHVRTIAPALLAVRSEDSLTEGYVLDLPAEWVRLVVRQQIQAAIDQRAAAERDHGEESR